MGAKTIVFDLDGTLADTSADLIAAANWCFEDLGLGAVLDPATDAATALRGGRAMLKLGFSRVDAGAGTAEIDRQYPKLLAAYADCIDRETTLYPGAIAAIESLRAQGWKTAICTNKPEGLAETLMGRLGVRDLFGSLIGADTLATRKPDAAPYVASVEQAGGSVARSLLIGDTITDRDTARAAGVPVVLVTFGPAGGDMAALTPDALLAAYDDLPDLADALVP
ncbi:MAG: HAD-IA family hydrolase [Pseudomonadota bacterium]